MQSQNMRNALFEIFGETRKRKENYTSEGLWKRSYRSTSNDYLSYFSEKHEREILLGQDKLKLKKVRAWFTGSTNPTGKTDSASSTPAYSAAEFSHVRNFKMYES